MHLDEIKGHVDGVLESEAKMDDTTRAHLIDVSQRIDTVLDADVQASSP